MRFDIVLNNLAGLAWTKREIRLSSDGTPWRPLVHIADIGRAILETLSAPADAVRSEIFNVGSDDQNYRVLEIADAVSAAFPDCRVTRGSNMGDNRSYRVSFQKIREHLPAYTCAFDAKAGARQLRALFQRLDMSQDVFEAPPYTRLHQLRTLLKTGQVDDSLFWRGHALS
jgi:nucleoside-diphosphate-sugar epimerase